MLAGLLISMTIVGGCGDQPLETSNRTARITSVGPVELDERFVEIQYTLRDREGDDQNVDVEICPAASEGDRDCMTPVQGLGGDGTERLPTVPKDTDVPHRYAWRVGCGLVDGEQCRTVDLQTAYVARVTLGNADRSETSAPFTLSDDLQISEVPECDPRVEDVPAPCQSDDQT